VTGVVYSWEETQGITVAEVTVGVFGEQTTTTTDANGRFTLQNVPDGNVFFTTMANGYWGLVDYYLVPQETEGRDVWLNLWTPVDQTSVIVDRWMCDGSICTFGELLFPSVDPANGPITATVTGVPGMTTCHVDETPGTEYPIIAKSLTIVYAWCEPAQ
jgi:hypothetical protein